ncbi:hypothetical protein MMC12_002371 [Toensbergia leucococca]|nr:hypothetical protein [Toensbergia leucococca]
MGDIQYPNLPSSPTPPLTQSTIPTSDDTDFYNLLNTIAATTTSDEDVAAQNKRIKEAGFAEDSREPTVKEDEEEAIRRYVEDGRLNGEEPEGGMTELMGKRTNRLSDKLAHKPQPPIITFHTYTALSIITTKEKGHTAPPPPSFTSLRFLCWIENSTRRAARLESIAFVSA